MLIKRICIAVLVCWSGMAMAATHNLTASHKALIARNIDAMIKKSAPNANVGIEVRSITYGGTVYEHNPSHLFVPASSMKTLTAQAALLELGPQFTFKTKLLIDKKPVVGGVLSGSAAIVFDGDPQLTTKNLEAMFAKLKLLGIKTIKGNFIIDTTAFADDGIGPGWMWDELKYCYAAPIDASIVNRNCMAYSISPGAVGAKPHVYLSQLFSSISVDNQAITKPAKTRCYPQTRIGDGDVIHLSGCMAQGQKRQWFSASITDTKEFDKEIVLQLLKKNGVKLNGKIVFAKAGTHYKTIAIHDSKTVKALIHTMLKESDNIIAGALFKKVGQQYFHQTATWELGGKAVAAILSKRAGINFRKIDMVDGSGLSRYDLISPEQLANLMIYGYKDFPYTSDFITSLPVSGRDGTLKWRMGNKTMINKVKAKTGTMAGVSSLTGYLFTKNKEVLAFSIMVNGYVGSSAPARQLQDKVLSYLWHLRR